jgi:hypothetical protein
LHKFDLLKDDICNRIFWQARELEYRAVAELRAAEAGNTATSGYPLVKTTCTKSARQIFGKHLTKLF